MKVSTTRIIAEITAALLFLFLPLLLVPVVSPLAVPALLQPVLQGILIIHGSLIILYYWNYYYAIPQLYFGGKKKTFAAISLLFVLLLCLLAFADRAYNPFPSPPFRYPVFIFILSILLRFAVIMFICFALASYTRLQKSEEANLRSELAYLKAQINPHFLFNTLNSLYALAVTRSEKTPDAISRLSAIMRYVIDDAAADLVPLERELNYTSAYIELEKLRLNKKVNLVYEIRGEAKNKKIAPLLLLPIVENAFKHGVSASDESTILISITIEDKTLNLRTQNTTGKKPAQQGTGLGLSNVQKRLELLYPGKHELTTSEKNNEFITTLMIETGD